MSVGGSRNLGSSREAHCRPYRAAFFNTSRRTSDIALSSIDSHRATIWWISTTPHLDHNCFHPRLLPQFRRSYPRLPVSIENTLFPLKLSMARLGTLGCRVAGDDRYDCCGLGMKKRGCDPDGFRAFTFSDRKHEDSLNNPASDHPVSLVVHRLFL